jgi:hypothetical protein
MTDTDIARRVLRTLKIDVGAVNIAVTPPYAASAFRGGEIFHAQLDLFGPPTSADPLPGLAVRPPAACPQCRDPVATVGPGKPPHYASLRCRFCNLHRGWLSRVHHAYLTKVINTAGAAPREPIVPHTRTSKPEPDDDGVSVVQRDMRKE